MTEKEFTKAYLRTTTKKNPEIKYEIEKELVLKSFFKEKEYTHYLVNAYAEYNLEPDSLEEVLNRYINSSLNLYQEAQPININRIVPIIKPQEYLEEVKMMTKVSDVNDYLVYERYNDELVIVFAEDTDLSIRYFSKDEFHKLNIQTDTLLDFSIKNLKDSLPEIERHGDNITYMITAGGDYEASLILMDNIWTKDNFPVDGDFVIGIPNRDLLFVTGSKEVNEIKRLKELLKNSYETGNHQVSPHLFIRKGDRFAKYK
ncbi:MAG: DUF1444 family protein [Carboxylicivirga sp.]|jgi:uncharacterized protein YtpQ (UPF0354 family)|nr:DUF1444 family protein [Carboxylicivirga sp.]